MASVERLRRSTAMKRVRVDGMGVVKDEHGGLDQGPKDGGWRLRPKAGG